ncbi:hypothetical protein ACFQPA_07680 [Halomarina halobia]|uniref:Uncharacterized protein n=1 Tax=Halomarina halobia TaxID=3033386 RepID=A0ABD6ADR4_9EURY|nr:hypothetical protein [Halomarina sp. PSR21]
MPPSGVRSWLTAPDIDAPANVVARHVGVFTAAFWVFVLVQSYTSVPVAYLLALYPLLLSAAVIRGSTTDAGSLRDEATRLLYTGGSRWAILFPIGIGIVNGALVGVVERLVSIGALQMLPVVSHLATVWTTDVFFASGIVAFLVYMCVWCPLAYTAVSLLVLIGKAAGGQAVSAT